MRCAYPKCKSRLNLRAIPLSVRCFIAKNVKIYIHRLARGCPAHIQSNSWISAGNDFPLRKWRNQFSSQQIEDFVNLLANNKTKEPNAITSK